MPSKKVAHDGIVKTNYTAYTIGVQSYAYFKLT